MEEPSYFFRLSKYHAQLEAPRRMLTAPPLACWAHPPTHPPL